MRLIPTLLFLAGGSVCSAQLVRDFTEYRAIGIGLIADAKYSVRKMNIPITGMYSVSGDHMEDATNSYFITSGTTGLAYMAGIEKTLIGSLLSISPLTALTTMGQIIAAESNTQFRYYAFYVPVRANCTVSAYLVGDWDRPRNRVVITSQSGNRVLDYNEQLGSSQYKIFQLTLDPGIHIAMVGLGGGSSVLLHSAGELRVVMLDSPTTLTWTMPVIIQQNVFKLTSYLPSQG